MKELLWQATLDGRYTCTVREHPDDVSLGLLEVRETSTGKVITRREVTLAYGAMFGVDVDDVELWKRICIEVGNAHTKKSSHKWWQLRRRKGEGR